PARSSEVQEYVLCSPSPSITRRPGTSCLVRGRVCSHVLFFFIASAPPEIYTLSLHDALPILKSLFAGLARCPKCGETMTRVYKGDRKSTRLNSSHLVISYAVFCLKKKKR